MIKLSHILSSNPTSLNEGSSIPGAVEGWLEPNGKCHYVEDTHADWAARYLKQTPPDPTDIGAYETKRMVLMRQLYDKGWVRVIIQHGENILYFDTYNIPWQSLTRAQRQWLYNAAMNGVKIQGDQISVGDEPRESAYHLKFGNGGGRDVSDIMERK